jgi:hypothetical protein
MGRVFDHFFAKTSDLNILHKNEGRAFCKLAQRRYEKTPVFACFGLLISPRTV